MLPLHHHTPYLELYLAMYACLTVLHSPASHHPILSHNTGSKDTNVINANRFMGMAHEAKLAFFDIGVDDYDQDLAIPFDLNVDLFPPAYTAGARVHSNSWGGGYWYDIFCQDTDRYLYNNEEFVTVFAAGNDGGSGLETILSPGLSKNAIAAGSTHNTMGSIGKVSVFSAKGPTNDGRIKPDILAPGQAIKSSRANSEGSTILHYDLTSKSGTSMAAPVTAGNMALIQQYFRDPAFWEATCDPAYALCRGGAFRPWGSLVKALAIGSGVEVDQVDEQSNIVLKSPDIYQGFGRVQLNNVLPVQPAVSSFMLYIDQASIAELQEVSYTCTVHSACELSVTVAWYDPPNEIYAARTLLHDLDLVVVDPRGNIFYGNSHNDDGTPVLGGRRDEVNNNERVRITSALKGDWTVKVQSKFLSEADTQNFSLVVTAAHATMADGHTDPVPISPAVLNSCAINGHADQLEMEAALFSRVEGGWFDSDQYTVTYTDGTEALHTGMFDLVHGNAAFFVDPFCISAGYGLNKHYAHSSTHCFVHHPAHHSTYYFYYR